MISFEPRLQPALLIVINISYFPALADMAKQSPELAELQDMAVLKSEKAFKL
jgi:hypothetical protein